MKTSTVRGHARKLRRICDTASFESMVPDHLPNAPVLVGDLPEFVFIRIGAYFQCEKLECALKQYISERRGARSMNE